MRFQSRFRSISYTVEPARQAITLAGGEMVSAKAGLRADFLMPGWKPGEPGTGNPAYFDSVATQRKYGWTDEQRVKVEAHLLAHADFGHGLYLAPGETVPAVHAHLIQATELVTAPEAPTPEPVGTRCMFVKMQPDGQSWQCGRKTKAGEDYCFQHATEAAALTATA
jgi:hypothetical protein